MDTTTGHWEMMGIVTERPFPTYPTGFRPGSSTEFARATGRGVIGNVAASGTEIIERLGAEHERTGSWIVYTSADSVFQIAAHEAVVPLEELYAACRDGARDPARRPRGGQGHREALRGGRGRLHGARPGGTTSRSSRRARTTSSASVRRG